MTDTFDNLKSAFADRYPIERQIGAGGMATVYLARDLKHGREVAVKVLRPELALTIGADRFLREIEIAARLTHPHILPLYDSGRADEFLFYVMPYVDGESLRHRLVREPQLPVVEALGIAREVADALSYAHANNIVHRDIKPENILTHAGHVMIADFGIARAMTLSTVEPLTRAGVMIGTPAYMSPEQVGGEPNVGSRSDIYSLGCVLYEMLAGQPPFSGPTPDSICRQHISAKVPAVTAIRPLVPRGVADIIDGAMAKRPADRYPTTDALVEELSMQASLETDPSARASLRTRAVRRRWVFRGSTAVVGAVLIATLANLLRDPARSPSAVASQRQVTFVGDVVEASISPQGNFLAYTTKGPDRAALVVQDLGSSSAIEIASSPDLIVTPSWSRDGQEILVGISASSELRRLVYPRLGGNPYSVPTTGVATAQWSVDGRQRYGWSTSPRWFSLYTMESNSEKLIRTADTASWLYEVAQRAGGDVFATLHAARDGRASSIWLVRVDSAERFEKVPPDSAGVVSAAQYELLLEQDASLSWIEWSPSGDALYYLRDAQGSFELWKVGVPQGRATRDPPELLLSGLEVAAGGEAGSVASLLSITEDGSRLFYVKGRTFSNLWSLVRRGDAWEVAQLTTGTAANLLPNFSPDGESIAYKSTVAGRSNVFVVPVAGGSPRQLTHVDSVSGYPVWSPDGESLAFGIRRGGGNHVVTINLAGPPRMKVFEATALSGNGTITWAPGSEILYQRPGLRNFHFLNPQTEAERPLFSEDSAAVGFVLQARYSPDRKQFAVSWNRSGEDAGIYVIPLGAGVQRRLTTQSYASPIGWSEDGRTVYAISEDRRAVLAVPVDGGTPTVLETLPFEAHHVGTTNYGRGFVFASLEATGDVWRIENFDPGR